MATVSLLEASETLLMCVNDALEADLRPVCRAYQAVGTPVIRTCCECDEGHNGELSVHFRRLFDADPSSLSEILRVRPCKGGVTAAQFRLVLARCMPTIDEHGEVPDTELVIEKAEEQTRDGAILWQSLACCSNLDLRIDDVSVDEGPMGGCSIIYADVTVLVRVPPLPITN